MGDDDKNEVSTGKQSTEPEVASNSGASEFSEDDDKLFPLSEELKELAKGPIDEFFTFKDFDECYNFAQRYLFEFGNSDSTYVETEFEQPPEIYSYTYKMLHSTSDEQKSGVVGKYLQDVLFNAAPLSIGLWFLNKETLTTCLTEISKVEYDSMRDLFKKSAQQSKADMDELRFYQECARKFREGCKSVFSNNVFHSSVEEVPKEVFIPAGFLNDLYDFYKVLVRRRTVKLNNERDIRRERFERFKKEGGSKKKTITIGHYNDYYDFLIGKEHSGFIELEKRSRGSEGNHEFGIGASSGTSKDKSPKNGYLLLSTALEQHIRINNLSLSAFKEKTEPIWKTAVAEVGDMYAKQAAQQKTLAEVKEDREYSQQCANIDIIFNFFLHISTIGYKGVDNELKNLNTYLNIMGQKIYGKEKINRQINKTKYRINRIAKYFNKTKSIHMPPYAITEHRLYDWVAVFGIIRLASVQVMKAHPGISTRYFTHFRLDDPQAISALLSFNILETSADPHSEIRESEHMFHQMLLGKRSAYEPASDIKGDAFNIIFEVLD